MNRKWLLILGSVVGILVLLVAGIKFVTTPLRYKYAAWGSTGWGKAALYNFCRYSLPPNYEPRRESYWFGWPNDDRELVFFKRQDSGQFLIFLKLPEHISINLDGIKLHPALLKDTFRRTESDIDDEFMMRNFLPVLFSDPFASTPSGVWIHGLNHGPPARWATPTTEISYHPGRFQQIALEKPHPWWKRYPISVIEFHQPMRGALAVVRHKEKGWTLFAIGAVVDGKSFDEAEFKQVLNSITFDAEPYKAPTWEAMHPLPKGWPDFPPSANHK